MNRKQIEEKAIEYASNMNERCDGFFNCRSIMDAYFEGAKKVLTSQWKDTNKEVPQDGSTVVVVYENCSCYEIAVYDSKMKVFINKTGRIVCNKIDYWMPVPELPKINDII